MPTTTTEPKTPTRDTSGVTQLGWLPLLRAAALAVALTAVITQLAGRFVGPSLVVLAVLCVTGAALAGRRRRVAAAVLLVACLLNLLLHGWVVGLVAAAPDAGLAVALSSVDLVGSLLTIVAAVAVLLRRTGPGRAPVVLAIAGVTVVVLASVATFSLYLTRDSVDPAQDEVVVVNDGQQVLPASVTLDAEAGTATLVVRNADLLYPRSFDIDALDLHMVVPPRTGVRVTLPVGEHTFYDFATMSEATSGTITVLP